MHAYNHCRELQARPQREEEANYRIFLSHNQAKSYGVVVGALAPLSVSPGVVLGSVSSVVV